MVTAYHNHRVEDPCPDDCNARPVMDGSTLTFQEWLDPDDYRSDTVTEVIDGREGVYGEPVDGMRRVAAIWSAILGKECTVQPADVPLMLIGMKLVRAHQAPDYSDNSDDIEGYLDIFRKVVGPDMIHARSVTDYLEQKAARG